jgi:hypothetical protein
MTEKGLIAQEKDSRIAPWGAREDLREIARRVQLMAPGGKKLAEGEALALAQGAIAHGLDPFNGEIWYIPGAGLMAGIKGLRKAARKQIEGNFWTEFEEITDPDQRDLLMIPERALAYRCLIRDSETLRAYSGAWKELREQGIPDNMIPELLGRKPYCMGIGYVKAGEPTKMDPVQVAMKRAEADALKRRFDLPFAVASEPNDGAIINGDWHEQDEPAAEKVPGAAADALFGPDPEAKPVEAKPTEAEPSAKPANGKRADLPSAYWTVVRKAKLSREEGQRALEECGGDFELARKKIEEQHLKGPGQAAGQEKIPF